MRWPVSAPAPRVATVAAGGAAATAATVGSEGAPAMMESPHLCLLYVATAGQQGPALGADEEEIVLLAYVMIDLTLNKVVGVNQYLVKPRTADINENVLSEQLVQETRLTEELVKSGQPLEAAIQAFDQYLRATLHAGAVRLVTDGQLPLRQCLHPEACSKGLDLPHYYNSFFDLRKEFHTFYDATKEINSISDMVKYLSMVPETDAGDFYVREIRDMVNITMRLLADGHKFEEPEVINLRLEPGICSKNEEVDNNCVVRARGLPWQSSDQDIAKFFRGLNVAKGGVALCLSPQGRRNGEALVRFVNQEHRDMALKRHKHHIGNRYIEVYRASGEDFINVAGGNNNEAQAFLSRGGQVIVRMRGLPYDCTAKQVLEFFESGENSCKVMDDEEGVLFVKKPDGRATGDAFVLFAQEEDAAKALSKHRELIGSRYIELFRSTTAEVQQVLNRSMDPKTYEQQQPLIAQIPQVPLLPQHIITSGTRKDCIRLRGLPYEAQVEHILEFLGEHAKSIVFQGVHMVYNAQGQPSGEAFIQMDSEQSAFLSAQQKHHRYMTFGKKQRYIEVFQCSGEDMNLVLTGGIPTSAVSPAKAAALLSPGMLAHPHTQTHALPPALPPPQAVPAGPLTWETHPLIVAAAAAHRDPLWLMNQLAAAQHQQQQQQQQVQQQQLVAAIAADAHVQVQAQAQAHVQAAAAAAAAAAAVAKRAWGEMNGGGVGGPTAVSGPGPSTPALPPPPTSAKAALHAPAGAVYAPLIHHASPFPGTSPTMTSGLVFLNVPPRLPVALQAQAATPSPSAPSPYKAAAPPQYPPPQAPAQHPPPPHGMLPQLVSGPGMGAAAALVGLKRSWEQAFPADLQGAGVKRQWQPPTSGATTVFHPQASVPHPAAAVAYQTPFYSAL